MGDQLVDLRQASVHALTAERTRDVCGVACQPDPATPKWTRKATVELNHTAPVHALGQLCLPRNALDEQRAQTFDVRDQRRVGPELEAPATCCACQWTGDAAESRGERELEDLLIAARGTR